jgi:multiple sugar transport system ATP-binding protein
MARVKLQDVRKSFGDDVAIHDASFEVHDGEFMVLVGPSAAESAPRCA